MKLFVPILTIALIAGTSLSSKAQSASRPNILYFYVDDMGWGAIGPNGQTERKAKGLPSVRTPNLDRLAAEGVNFVRGYGCHVCSPARSSQQSGFHQGHTFADRNDPDNAKKAMRADEVLMGDALSQAGYVTGYWGKWGYGASKDQKDPVIQNVQTLPTSHGYRHVLAELHHVRAHTFFQPTLWHAPAGPDADGDMELVANSISRCQKNASYPGQPALQNHARYPSTAYADDPHFDQLSDQTRQWAAMVTRIDAHFGNLLAALNDPDNDGDTSDSIADNTLVVFQSDNGGPKGKNHTELNVGGELRGNKGQIQEGGIRVPLVMRWPAQITADSRLRAGTDSDLLVDVTDLLPTFCELAGTSAPLGVDGVSIAPTLRGSGHQRKREFIIHEAGNGASIIRGDFKLIRQATRRGKSVGLQLYHLGKDPAEENDLASRHPALVEELEALLLGERVDEPKGFAVTYHRWTGADGETTSDRDNWSDYRYSNAGITYLTDDGPPKLSWIARMENNSDRPKQAVVDSEIDAIKRLQRNPCRGRR